MIGDRIRVRSAGPVADWILALALALLGAAKPIHDGLHGESAVLLALDLCATLPLGVRRRRPLSVLTLVVAVTVAVAIAYHGYWFLPAAVALYTVAAHCARPLAIRAGLAAAVPLAVATAVASHWQPLTLLRLVPFAAAWILGDNLRTRRAYLRALEDRTTQLEREQEANARRAAAEEQARIAREVHDVVAHNLSVIVVQSTAADAVFDDDPAEARRAVRAVGTTARQALDELRRVLAGIGGAGAELAPQPDLSGLPALLDSVRAAGLAVDLEVAGERRELEPAVELSAFRIVQEALTNTLRHAGAHHATVSLRFDQDALGVTIVDDGRSGPSVEVNGGRGLIGMRERVATFGGRLEAAPDAAGGFRVAARLPLAGTHR